MKNTISNRIYSLAIISILMPFIIGIVIMGIMLNNHLKTGFQNRLQSNINTFSIIITSELGELVKGVKGLSTDNTIKQTLQLGMDSQLNNYLEIRRKYLGFSDIIISDTLKNISHNVAFDSILTEDIFKNKIRNNNLTIVSTPTIAKIIYTRKILYKDKSIGYVTGSYNLLGKSNLKYLEEKLMDSFGFWYKDELIYTNYNNTDEVKNLGKYRLKEKNLYENNNLLVITKKMKFDGEFFSYGIIFSMGRDKNEILKLIFLMLIGTLFLFSMILLTLSRYMKNLILPIKQLTFAAESIEKGYEMPPIKAFNTEEFERMSAAFKNMVTKLKRSEMNIISHRDYLQKMVIEKTKDIQTSNDELKNVIQQQQETEKALKESEEQFRNLAENTPMVIMLIQNEQIVYVNPSTLILTGYELNEINKIKFLDIVHPDYRDKLNEIIKYNGADLKAFCNYEIKILPKNGDEIWVKIFAGKTYYENKPAVLTSILDITDLKITTEELKSQKENISMLSDTALELLELPPDANIYDFICIKLQKFIGNGLISISSVDIEKDSFTVESVVGIENKINILSKFLGFNLIGYTTNGLSKFSHILKQNVILEITNNLEIKKHQFVRMIMSKPAKKIMNIKNIYAMPLIYSNRINSLLIIALPLPLKDEIKQIVISYISQAATSILRKNTEIALQKSEERYRNIFSNAPIGIFRTTPSGYIEMANNALIQMLEYNNLEELQSRNLEIHDESNRTLFKRKLDYNNNVLIGHETKWQKKDNTFIDVRENAHAYYNKNNEIEYFEGTVEDISKQKETEEILKKAVITAEHANKAKSEFLANMSHEIRTPLNAILGFSELLTDMINDPIQNSYLNSIQVSGKSLLTLINDILDLSKIEAGKFKIDFEAIDPIIMLQEIEQIFQKDIIEKDLNFFIEIDENIPKQLMLDEARFRQILLNLVGNAIKFTSTGFVKISMRKISENPQKKTLNLEIQIEDSGIGIPEEDQQIIFESFKQRDGQSTRKFGGTGLGLSICKKLLEMMNGEIFVKSEVGKGSTFLVLLKDVVIAQPKVFKAEIKTFDTQNIKFKKSKILIVDDVHSNIGVLNAFLQNIGMDVIAANNGEEAFNIAEEFQPDLIIMDILMPVMDGIESTKLIKKSKITQNIPVIALTASPIVNEKNKDVISYFDAFLQKPVNKAILYKTLTQFIPNEVINHFPAEPIKKETKRIIKNREKLLEILEDKILPKIEEMGHSMIISDIEDFSDEIIELGHSHHADILIEKGENLKKYSQQFDIEKIGQCFSDLQKTDL